MHGLMTLYIVKQNTCKSIFNFKIKNQLTCRALYGIEGIHSQLRK